MTDGNFKVVILLARPRGFCAGVDRAISVVKNALLRFGVPVYVKHEIVHNKYVVDGLRAQGAVFVEDVCDVPEGGVLVFSAHGVSCKVEEEAKEKKCTVIDATCPLVKKVHNEVSRNDKEGHEIILVGHRGHPEIEGTAGRAFRAEVSIIEDAEAARNFVPKFGPEALSFSTQTTLSMDDTREVHTILKERFPVLAESRQSICYATQNRQNAVRELVDCKIKALVVVGSHHSSNSNRLRDIGANYGLPSMLVPSEKELEDEAMFEVFDKAKHEGHEEVCVGVTAGASAPEVLTQGVILKIQSLAKNRSMPVEVREVGDAEEGVFFHLPKIVRDV